MGKFVRSVGYNTTPREMQCHNLTLPNPPTLTHCLCCIWSSMRAMTLIVRHIPNVTLLSFLLHTSNATRSATTTWQTCRTLCPRTCFYKLKYEVQFRVFKIITENIELLNVFNDYVITFSLKLSTLFLLMSTKITYLCYL